MTEMSEKLDEKNSLSKPTQGEAVLESVFKRLAGWQNKASDSVEGVKESIKKMEESIQSTLGERLDFSKMNGSEVFAFLSNPAHFTTKEKALIRALFVEAGKLKKTIQSGGKVKKIKFRRSNQQFV